ncbi:MAG: STAS domain-containing protein [Pseudomonadales bacterium]|nr:STAS domain-containing protein [Pseudomonadales bacterium]MCP5215064.1 STAS domain-containing protein [Pseudomonadales bacterium]
MNSGKILVAKKQGVYVLKFVGDVRLTLCTALDIFVERMMADRELNAVFIDLSDTQGIDSTSLGFIAKIAISTQKNYDWKPTIISVNPDITRILLSMGFDAVFEIINQRIDDAETLNELHALECTETQAKDKVIEAHRILMGLNDENKEKFQELVEMLETQ